MSATPIVVIGVRGGVVNYKTSDDVRIVFIDWDRLAAASLGILVVIYKKLWTLPEDLRQGPMTELIGEVKRRFPIKATFQPQRWENDYAVPAGSPVTFDVTAKLLWQGPDVIDNLRDDSYPTDDLADNLPERLTHEGPFLVNVKDAAMEFLFADENEVQGERKGAT